MIKNTTNKMMLIKAEEIEEGQIFTIVANLTVPNDRSYLGDIFEAMVVCLPFIVTHKLSGHATDLLRFNVKDYSFAVPSEDYVKALRRKQP